MVGDNKFLRQLRQGIPPHKNVLLGNGKNSLMVAVVSLSADEMQRLDELTEEYAQQNPSKVNGSVRSQYYNKLLAMYCMRNPSDPKLEARITEDIEEVGIFMDIEDIARVCNAYGELMINKAPKLEALTQDQYDVIKKHLEVTPLSDLSTVLLVHLANCHQTIVSEK